MNFITRIIILALILSSGAAAAQMQLDWVKIFNGPYSGGEDVAKSIVVDDSGNVYVTGASQVSSVTFECVTIKYDKSGDSLWVRHYFRTGNYTGHDIKLDDSGNIFVAAGVIIKYNNSGDLIWDNYDQAAYKEIILDSAGNIFAGGIRSGQLTAGKYSKDGVRIWKKTYSFPGSAGTDLFGGIALDKSGNFIITGPSKATATFYDYATIKYSNAGDLLWERRYNGPSSTSDDGAYGITTDLSGNVFVTGYSMDVQNRDNCLTIKYDSSGNIVWISRIPINTMANVGYNLATDSSSNLFIAGRLGGRTSIIKLDVDANVIWYKIYPQGNSIADNYPIILLDSAYNVYTTAIGITNTYSDYVALKYDSSGNLQFSLTYSDNNIYDDYVYDLAYDNESNVILTGQFGSGHKYGTVKFSPIITGITLANSTPDTYFLGQNYPNPFNPKTIINYEIGIKNYVQLKVYDVLGNEITTLVNERQSAGSYQVEFDGSNLPSGIYFYKLTAGNFSEVKKMTLLK